MNSNFREHVTGVAFNLQLSKPMCDAMYYFMREEATPHTPGFRVMLFGSIPMITTAMSLARRGLIEQRWNHGRDISTTPAVPHVARGAWRVTDEGKKVFELLVLAGLCNPLSATEAA